MMIHNDLGWRVGALSLLFLAACEASTAPSTAPFPVAGAPGAAGTSAGAPGAGGAGASSVGGTSGASAAAGTSGSNSAGSAGAPSAGASGSSGGDTGGTSGGSGVGGTSGGGVGGTSGGSGAGGTAGNGSGGTWGTGMGGLTAGKQTKRPITMPYAKNGFLEYLPKGYGDGTKWPLLVFWAGVGENGTGSASDLDGGFHHGPPKLIAANQWPSDRPFVVLTPQHNGQLPYDRPTADETHDFITFALAHYDIDPAHVYLTALSSGAKGAWDYLVAYKGAQVAAAVLIAGDASEPYGKAGCAIVNEVPVWDFHGTADTEQSYPNDSAGMANFQSCPQPRKEVKFTSYTGATHQQSWERTYDLSAGNDIYAWLLTKAH